MSVVEYKGQKIEFIALTEKFQWREDPEERHGFDTLALAKKAVDSHLEFKRFPALAIHGYDPAKVVEVTVTSGKPNGSFTYVDEKGERHKSRHYERTKLYYDTPDNRALLNRYEVLELAIQEFKKDQADLLKKAKYVEWKGYKDGDE